MKRTRDRDECGTGRRAKCGKAFSLAVAKQRYTMARNVFRIVEDLALFPEGIRGDSKIGDEPAFATKSRVLGVKIGVCAVGRSGSDEILTE